MAQTITALTFLLLALLVSGVSSTYLTDRIFEWTRNPENYTSEGKKLSGHVFQTFYNKYAVSQCAYECLKKSKCKSFNFRSSPILCELNSDTHLDQPTSYINSSAFEYHMREAFSIDPEALGPCAGDKCGDHGHCFETLNPAMDLIGLCMCDIGWTGSNCDLVESAPAWGDWEPWSECSVTCGNGWMTRSRNCEDTINNVTLSPLECYGKDIQFDTCTLQACPRWDSWGSWGECSASRSCGRGYKVRSRTCNNGGRPGIDRYCMGPTNETTPCYGINCRGPMRLGDGSRRGEGRVELFNDKTKEWGNVCADQMTSFVAQLVCKQLGLPGAFAEITDGRFGSGTGQFAITNLTCLGSEKTMPMCDRNPWTLVSTCNDGTTTAAGVLCNVHGSWSLWSSWSDCSVTCENGTSHRTRACDHPPALYAGRPCPGESLQTKACSLPECPINGEWMAWSTWSQCSETCGDGTQSRSRTCRAPLHGGKVCPGSFVDYRGCNDRECPVDGQWKPWELWGDCSKTCGGGQRSRSRTCKSPLFGGDLCPGSNSETEDCNANHCPVDGVWLEWAVWGDCDVTCGGGTQERTRKCNEPQYNGKPCEGSANETRICNDFHCPADGLWLPWNAWSQCSKTCGEGSQRRERTCHRPTVVGKNCVGDSFETQTCVVVPCPLDGYWREWQSWGECSVTCGGGTRERKRECVPAQHGGADCPGSAVDTQGCSKHSCPVDGMWKVWEPWSDCSHTCGDGIQTRTRQCVAPVDGGKDCQGPAVDKTACNLRPCPVDGRESDWSPWSECTLTCGSGSQWRNRTCIGPFHQGRDCAGPLNETQDCNTQACPVDGVWAAWGDWGACNVTCDGGISVRMRQCFEPQHGGKPCEGASEQFMPCSDNPCLIPGEWMAWSNWSSCSATCDGGKRNRSRVCNMQTHGNRTAPCQGHGDEIEDCHTFSCSPYETTCSGWQKRGLTESTLADVDPDGTGHLSSVKVYCDMIAENGVGVTVIGHDMEATMQVRNFEGAGDFTRFLTYNVSFDHAVAIVEASGSCRQYISWKCKAAVIHNPNDQSRTTGWRTRMNKEADYFGGAPPGSGMCKCGTTQTCANSTSLRCNCDANDEVWREDAGYLTYKPDLPMRSFFAGDTGEPEEEGVGTVGLLYCYS